MNMKKTIALLAIVASSNANALRAPFPNGEPSTKTVCLRTWHRTDGSAVGSCDESYNNQSRKTDLKENGCGADQVALTVLSDTKIEACLPPGAVQL